MLGGQQSSVDGRNSVCEAQKSLPFVCLSLLFHGNKCHIKGHLRPGIYSLTLVAIVEDSGMINGPEGRKLSEPHMEEWQQLGFSSATVLPGLKIGFYEKSDYLGRRTFFLLYSFFFFRFF